MFGFLKKSIKGAISKISDKIKREGKPAEEPEIREKLAAEEKPSIEEKPEEKEVVEDKFKSEEEIPEPEEDEGSKGAEELESSEKEKPEEEIPEPELEKEEISEVEKEKTKEEKPETSERKSESEKEELEEERPEPNKQIIEKEEVKVSIKKETIKEEESPLGHKEKPKKESKEKEPEIEKEEKPKESKKKGFFQRITEKVSTTTINEKQFEDMFHDLEIALLENNVAVEVIDKIKDDMKKEIVDAPIRRGKIENKIIDILRISVNGLFKEPFDIVDKIKEKKPYVICFIGINGSGKTTTIAKVAHLLKHKGKSVVLAASDTFRAASIEQMQKHADNLGVKLIKHDYGSDPAAVAFDAVKHAVAKDIDVVLIDTAGRMHSNSNLMDEMRKIVRVAKPDLKIFVGESITGNDCVEQAKSFNDAVGIDGIVLSKADIDEKGGAAVSVSYVTQKPIILIGTGQEYGDLKKFDPELVVKSLGL